MSQYYLRSWAEDDPVRLAKEQGINSHFYADTEMLTDLLSDCIKSGPQMGLLDGGRELPCYFLRIEEFYTPICYDPPASRLVIVAHDRKINEWLLLGTNWFTGINDMMLPSHLFVDELDMLVEAVRNFSSDAKVRIYATVDIIATTRNNHIAARMESQSY